MRIVINKTSHGIYVNKVMLIPGTNCLDSFDCENSAAKLFIDNGEIEVNESDKMDSKAQENAVKNANTLDELDKVQKVFKKVDVSKQKKKLEDFDKAIKEESGSDKD